MINHEEASGLLCRYAYGELPADLTDQVDQHLAGCEDCREQVAEYRRLREQSRELPREVEPERDLWGGIAAAIAADNPGEIVAAETSMAAATEPPEAADSPQLVLRGGDHDSSTEIRDHRHWFAGRRRTVLAVAAILVLALISARGILERERSSGPARLGPVAKVQIIIDVLAAECREGDLEIAGLLRLLDGGEAPPGLEKIKESIELVEQNIEQVGEAWLAYPENQLLARKVVRAYRTKVSLQVHAVRTLLSV